MKRQTILLLSVMVISLFISGCSKPAASGKAKVTFWTFDSGEPMDSQLKLLPDSIELELVTIPYNVYEQKLRVATNGGAAPDVFQVDGPYVANYVYSGMLKELDEYVDKAFWNDYVTSSQNKCSYNGKIYALSQNESSLILFYNKDHFAEAGITDIPAKWDDAWTYKQLIDAAVKLTKRDASGNIIRYGLSPNMFTPDAINEGMTFTLLNWLWNNGCEYVDKDYKTASGYLDSPQSIKVLQEFGELYTKYKVAPLQNIDQGFQTGKISMWVQNITNVGAFEKNFPELHFGVMPLPQGVNHFGTTGGWNFGISSQSKDPASAYKLLWALSGTEGQKILVEWKKAMPSLKSLMTLPLYTDDPRMLTAIEGLQHARSRDIIPCYAEISPILNELCNSVAYGEDPAALVKSAVGKIDRVIAKYPPLD